MANFAATLGAISAAPHHFEAWEAFKANFSRSYAGLEHQRRFEAFVTNLQHIDAENSKGLSYKLAVNQFADLTPAEFRHRLGFRKPSELSSGKAAAARLGTHVYSGEALADSVDWAGQGAVTPVKDQKDCGSCWAFSTTGSLEGALEIATGKLVALSEEQLIDCSTSNDACDGGAMDPAFEYLETVSVCTEDSYTYTAGKTKEAGECKASCDVALPSGGVKGYKDVEASEEAHMSALMKGPISVAVEADQIAFQLYDSGVLTGTCGTDLDHGVLAVGYGEEKGTKYWKVKNSWGSSWGEGGYLRIERGASAKGKCGILTMSSYPIVDADAPPAPPPAPEPTPDPTPTPASYCNFVKTQAECDGATQNGDACKWCSFLGQGLCMDPGFNCGEASCNSIRTQGDCDSATQNGETCTWCSFLGLGLCMDPGYDCDGRGDGPEPSPAPSPAPDPSPEPPSGQHHYGAPPCMDDELDGELDGASICAPPCSGKDNNCPIDVDPSCVDPQPQCILSGSDGSKYCGLVCGATGGSCPSGATCSDDGVCVYSKAKTAGAAHIAMRRHHVVV